MGVISGLYAASTNMLLWNCMRKYVLWKKFIEIEIREEIVAVTGFCENLFSIWVVLEDQVSFDVEVQVSETMEEP